MEIPQRIMALDVGDQRIGVALSDPLAMFAQPFSTISNKGKKAFQDILQIASEHNVGTIVVGFPYELDASVGEQAQKVQAFFDKLKGHLFAHPKLKTAKALLWDERLTSVQAERVIAGSDLRNRKRRAALDRVSAALILESYLESRKR